MNRDDILRMAREAGFTEPNHLMNPWSVSDEELERFAALVAAAERERFVAYPSGVVTGPCVCGSWPGGECLRCDVTDKAAAIIRAENERLREKLAKAWKTVG